MQETKDEVKASDKLCAANCGNASTKHCDRCKKGFCHRPIPGCAISGVEPRAFCRECDRDYYVKEFLPKFQKERKVVRVAIIGTAGRRSDEAKMTKAVFQWMVETATSVIRGTWNLEPFHVVLVSGGAAWADHVAVRLFLQPHTFYAGCTLHLPAPLAENKGEPAFLDTGSSDWKSNPGRTANFYHFKFAKKMGLATPYGTLEEISQVSRKTGGVLDSSKRGFMNRNSAVAQSDFLMAFTWWASLDKANGGGSYDTWTKCRGTKLHIPLHHSSRPTKSAPAPESSPPSRAATVSYSSVPKSATRDMTTQTPLSAYFSVSKPDSLSTSSPHTLKKRRTETKHLE